MISQPKPESTVIYDRHTIVGERKAAQQVGTLSFSVHMRQFTDGTQTTIFDVVEKTGAWAAATSVGSAAYESFTVDVTYTSEGTDHGDSADHVIKANTCKLQIDFAEGDPNVLNISGEFYEGLTRTGPA